MDVITFFHRSVEAFAARVEAVQPEQWANATPCPDWSVRDLVNHVTYENVWTVPLLDGFTVAEVGTRLDGDLLGDDPTGAAVGATYAALDAVDAALPSGGTVDTSLGAISMDEYARQIAVENLIHGWDVAVATNGDTSLDADLVEEVTVWFADREELFRNAGGIGPRLPLTGEAWPDLLARFGRDASWQPSAA